MWLVKVGSYKGDEIVLVIRLTDFQVSFLLAQVSPPALQLHNKFNYVVKLVCAGGIVIRVKPDNFAVYFSVFYFSRL